MSKFISTVIVLFISLNFAHADTQTLGPSEINMTLPAVGDPGVEMLVPGTEDDKDLGRVHFYARRNTRGSTVEVSVSVVAAFCGDFDGCKIRLGMHNWDNTGRVASRETLMYYNRTNHAWRASVGDPAGMDFDGMVQHVLQSWACYFTDGRYKGFKNLGDSELNFGLLSWSQYNADCRLTIID